MRFSVQIEGGDRIDWAARTTLCHPAWQCFDTEAHAAAQVRERQEATIDMELSNAMMQRNAEIYPKVRQN